MACSESHPDLPLACTMEGRHASHGAYNPDTSEVERWENTSVVMATASPRRRFAEMVTTLHRDPTSVEDRVLTRSEFVAVVRAIIESMPQGRHFSSADVWEVFDASDQTVAERRWMSGVLTQARRGFNPICRMVSVDGGEAPTTTNASRRLAIYERM
jgi:hypothetical protein